MPATGLDGSSASLYAALGALLLLAGAVLIRRRRGDLVGRGSVLRNDDHAEADPAPPPALLCRVGSDQRGQSGLQLLQRGPRPHRAGRSRSRGSHARPEPPGRRSGRIGRRDRRENVRNAERSCRSLIACSSASGTVRHTVAEGERALGPCPALSAPFATARTPASMRAGDMPVERGLATRRGSRRGARRSSGRVRRLLDDADAYGVQDDVGDRSLWGHGTPPLLSL